MDKIKELTEKLLMELGEDPNREGLLKTPKRVSNSWKFLLIFEMQLQQHTGIDLEINMEKIKNNLKKLLKKIYLSK